MSRGLDKLLTPIAMIMMIILLMTTMMIKTDDKATMILGANDNDGRYREDKSVTFFKQVSVKLEIRISEEPRGVQSPLGGRVGRGACERGWGGG